jgi:hypothetical protein
MGMLLEHVSLAESNESTGARRGFLPEVVRRF